MQTSPATLLLLARGLAALPAQALKVHHSVEVGGATRGGPTEVVGEDCSRSPSGVRWSAKCTQSDEGRVAMRTLTTTDKQRPRREDDFRHVEREGVAPAYEIVGRGPLPVASRYGSTLAVMDHAAGSTIAWSGELTAEGTPSQQAV